MRSACSRFSKDRSSWPALGLTRIIQCAVKRRTELFELNLFDEDGATRGRCKPLDLVINDK